MGGALARRPMREHQLRAFDLRPEVLGRFAERGAVPAQSAQALARESDLIMTCLPTSAEVRDVLFGEGRVAEVLQPGQIFADMTTGDPGETRDVAARLAEGGEDDRSGGPQGANAGTIAIMGGAPAELFAKVNPISETIRPNIFHTGGVGTGCWPMSSGSCFRRRSTSMAPTRTLRPWSSCSSAMRVLPSLPETDQAGEPRSTSISPLTRRPVPGLSGE
jgi:3-hydroxyisobutyrate dehydrogenase-like beta-hydroxyacid dehydrogenase